MPKEQEKWYGLKSDKAMNNHEKENKRADRLAELVIIAGVIMVLLSMASCRSVRYVPLERVRTEYINRTDTIRETDSIIHEKETIIREADSTLLAELGLKLRENERAILVLKRELEKQKREVSEHKTDTVILRDTVPVPYPVEKELTWYQSTCVKWFPWLLFIVAGILVYKLKPWRWLKYI